MRFSGVGAAKPDVDSIVQTIIDNQEGYDDVLFLGGEPCLFLSQLYECVVQIKQNTDLKVFVTTSVPKICYDQYMLFLSLLDVLDGINLSVQHHDEAIADQIRRTTSQYDRQEFYAALPHKDKIRINLNAVVPHLSTRDQITKCLMHYDAMGFNSIKLSEIQHGADKYVSFERLFGFKLGSPYSDGCQTYIDTSKILPGMSTPLLLKRSCFLCETTLKATLMDGVKGLCKLFAKPNNKYAVIYADGTLSRGWK